MVKLFYPKDASIALLEQFDHFLPYSSPMGAAMLSILGQQKRRPKEAGRGIRVRTPGNFIRRLFCFTG
jgi:hypothetical protein